MLVTRGQGEEICAAPTGLFQRETGDPGRCPGLLCYGLSGRLSLVAGWVCRRVRVSCVEDAGFRLVTGDVKVAHAIFFTPRSSRRR